MLTPSFFFPSLLHQTGHLWIHAALCQCRYAPTISILTALYGVYLFFLTCAPRLTTVNPHKPIVHAIPTQMKLMLSKFEYDGGLNPAFRCRSSVYAYACIQCIQPVTYISPLDVILLMHVMCVQIISVRGKGR